MTKRDIKFRRWDYEFKRFITWDMMINPSEINAPILALDKLPHEQYTGLKDVNGVEIYEGDILEDVKFPLRFTVNYEEDMAAFVLEPIGDLDEWKLFSETLPYHYEVIGNIHENPELLEV